MLRKKRPGTCPGVSPTQRALSDLRAEGWLPTVVEHWNHYAGKRQDLFGIMDVLAIRKGITLGLQVSSHSGHSARVKKLNEHESTPHWLDHTRRLEVWTYGLRKPEGSKTYVVTRRVTVIYENG